MNNPSQKKTLIVILLSLTIGFFLNACNCKKNMFQEGASTSEIKHINLEPSNHYKTLGKFSSAPNKKRYSLDLIRFPNKAHRLTIKIISPCYLNRNEIDSLVLKLAPPSNSSDQTKKELQYLFDLQKNRTPKQVEEALEMHDIVYFPVIGMRNQDALFYEIYKVIGGNFKPEKYPETKELLHNIMKEMRITEFTAKNHFLRARPRQLDSRLKPLKKMNTSSFASGHTLWAYMQAYLLGELIPRKRDDFIALAYKIGLSREILGVHFPSDEEASRILAHELLAKMWHKPKFIEAFNKAKTEWN